MTNTVTVSFRLSVTQFAELRLRAQEFSLAPAALARILAVEGLRATAHESEVLVVALARLEERLTLLEHVLVGRSDLAAATAALFVALGLPRAEAETWVRENLLSEEAAS